MIRAASSDDHKKIVRILQALQEKGDSYFFENMSDSELLEYWIKPDFKAFVFEENGEILGSYILGPIAKGRFSHIANASYVVDEKARGKGIGKALGLHSIEIAKRSSFQAMQFMRVVATNEAAVNSWKNLGFEIIGIVPQAFRHKEFGLVDSYIFYKKL